METAEVSTDKIVADLRVVIADAEELLRATAGQAGEKVAAARAKIQDSVATAKVKLERLSDAGAERAKAAAHATDDYVRDHPWESVGVAALVGFALGALISRR
jgi:ElaB/YqjD/DUF883 family membrane-anchored ribosome-binding protein